MDIKLDVLAISAHPDDIELSCSGTLIKLRKLGYATGTIALTSGELGTRGTAEIRRQEYENASRIMGLNAHKILDIPDGNVEVTRENKMKLIREIRTYRPNIIFTPYWHTRHPDHGNASHLVREAAFLAGLKKIDTGQPHFRPAKIIYFMELYEFEPSFIVDISDTFEEKLEAMKAYKSQFYNPDSEAQETETYISTPEFLQAIVTRSQYWGNKIGVKHGEPFLVREPIGIEDPVKLFGEPDPARKP